jgi:MoaA/NifB/PqqE/SkfB family radical SAM enzyme
MLGFVWLELTRKCNLECSHCYAESGPRLPLHDRMRHDDWLCVISECKSLGANAIQFIGGEPLLYPRIEELVSHARKVGIASIEIFTNSTPLTHEKTRLFAKYGVKFATSFYASDAATHDGITGRKGSFDKTVAGISAAIGRQIPVRAEIIDVTHSEELVSSAEDLLRSLGVTKVSRNRLQSVGRGQNGSRPRYSVGDLCGNCGSRRICITSEGSVFPCIMARKVSLGNVLHEPIAEIMGSTTLQSFRRVIDSEDRARRNNQRHPMYAAAEGLGDRCGPESPECGPSSHGCGPDHPCGPDGGCGPDDRHCGPDENAQTAQPKCGPESPECGPSSHGCGPDHPCGPDGGCGPDDRHCGPDENLN